MKAYCVQSNFSLYGGEIHVAVFRIVNRINTFLLMPISGIVQGMQPIIGYNYGAGLTRRVARTFKIGACAATAVAFIEWMMVIVIPDFLVKIFSTDPEVITNGAKALKWALFLVPMVGLPSVAGGLYQSMGKAKKAFILSISKPVLFLISVPLILPLFVGVSGVWLSFAIADGLSFLLAGCILLTDKGSF